MATKADLIEAQRYSRRRLRTAFTSGIPRGVELEPKNHLRAVIGGIAAAVLMVVGSLLFGYIKPSLPDGWENNKMLVGSSGARYVSMNGTLYPVANLASARLLLPSGSTKVESIDENRVAKAPRGPMVGIVGAPDFLPKSKDLVNSGWSACTAGGTTTFTFGAPDVVVGAAPHAAAVVRADGKHLLLMGGFQYELPESDVARNSVLRALKLDTVQIADVPASWVGLFTPGDKVEEWEIPFAGESLVSAPEFSVGDILVFDAQGEGQKYVVTADEELALVSDFALLLYGHSGPRGPQPRVVSQSEVDQLPPAEEPVYSSVWPKQAPIPLETPTALCAAVTVDARDYPVPTLATAASTAVLAPATGYTAAGGQVIVAPPAGGSLLEVWAERGVASSDTLYYVDSLGTAYPIPDALDGEVLTRLGYTAADIGRVPPGWIEALNPGPALTLAGARAIVGSSGQSVNDPDTPSEGSTPTEGTSPLPSGSPSPSGSPPPSDDASSPAQDVEDPTGQATEG